MVEGANAMPTRQPRLRPVETRIIAGLALVSCRAESEQTARGISSDTISGSRPFTQPYSSPGDVRGTAQEPDPAAASPSWAVTRGSLPCPAFRCLREARQLTMGAKTRLLPMILTKGRAA